MRMEVFNITNNTTVQGETPIADLPVPTSLEDTENRGKSKQLWNQEYMGVSILPKMHYILHYSVVHNLLLG